MATSKNGHEADSEPKAEQKPAATPTPSQAPGKAKGKPATDKRDKAASGAKPADKPPKKKAAAPKASPKKPAGGPRKGKAKAAKKGPPAQPKQRAGGHQAQMASLRKALVEACEAHWTEYVDALSERLPSADREESADVLPPERGDWIQLDDVDYTRQVEVGAHQVVFHDDEYRQPWAILIDKRFSKLIDICADVEISFRFERRTRWDIVGRVAGFDFVFDDYLRTRKVPTVRVNALHRPGQFVVFHHPELGPQVPGLGDAKTKLKTIHDKLRIPAAKEPRQLLDTLLTIIETGNFGRFVELSVEPPDPRMLRRRFEQFMKVYNECQGRVAFDRYAPDRSPENPGPRGEVKMFVTRTDSDGSTGSRPLNFVKEAGGWRIKSGIF